MVAKDSAIRDRIVALLESLPDELLAEVVSFLEDQRAKSPNRPTVNPPSLPTPMGGFWQGTRITEADIAQARREMWGRLADGSP